jgi:hypothetical protein
MGHPALQPHAYLRKGTAKLLTLFHPATGQVRVKGVLSSANVVWHPWRQAEASTILQSLPITLPQDRPPLRMLWIWDHLRGHYTPESVLWLFAHGMMPLYTPLGGSWLHMAESMQRMLVTRGLAGQYPETPEHLIALLEGVAKGWNQDPTPFAWDGNRAARRQRSRRRRHALGGSGACTRRPVRHRPSLLQKWRSSCQTTHYSPSPSGRGRGEGRIEPWKALVGANLPYTDAKTALGADPHRCLAERRSCPMPDVHLPTLPRQIIYSLLPPPHL